MARTSKAGLSESTRPSPARAAALAEGAEGAEATAAEGATEEMAAEATVAEGATVAAERRRGAGGVGMTTKSTDGH